MTRGHVEVTTLGRPWEVSSHVSQLQARLGTPLNPSIPPQKNIFLVRREKNVIDVTSRMSRQAWWKRRTPGRRCVGRVPGRRCRNRPHWIGVRLVLKVVVVERCNWDWERYDPPGGTDWRTGRLYIWAMSGRPTGGGPRPPPSIAFNLTPLPPLFCAISRLVYGRFECICHASG